VICPHELGTRPRRLKVDGERCGQPGRVGVVLEVLAGHRDCCAIDDSRRGYQFTGLVVDHELKGGGLPDQVLCLIDVEAGYGHLNAVSACPRDLCFAHPELVHATLEDVAGAVESGDRCRRYSRPVGLPGAPDRRRPGGRGRGASSCVRSHRPRNRCPPARSRREGSGSGCSARPRALRRSSERGQR